MARLSRRTAGSRVAGLAGSLADDLLRDEEDVFAQVASMLADGMVLARAELEDALSKVGDVESLVSSSESQNRIVDAHRETLSPCFNAAGGLLDRVVGLTVDSIREELRLCERTLGAAYRGLADEAVDTVVHDADRISVDALQAHARNLNPTVEVFRRDLRKQLLLAKQYEDTPEQLDKRLFTIDPSSRPGFSGRGIWHRSGSWVNASTRDASISTMNAVRILSMRRFNEIGAGRA